MTFQASEITFKCDKRVKCLQTLHQATVQYSAQTYGRDEEAYSESSQISNMELFVKINNK